METVVNLVTCVPYFRMARSVPVGVSVWNRLFSLSCTFTGVCAFLYHLSTGKIRNFFRRLDYTAVALSAVSLTCARTTEATRPLFAAALSAVLAPFQPLLVAGAPCGHGGRLPAEALSDNSSGPLPSLGLLGFAFSLGAQFRKPPPRAGTHPAATSLTGCLVQSQVLLDRGEEVETNKVTDSFLSVGIVSVSRSQLQVVVEIVLPRAAGSINNQTAKIVNKKENKPHRLSFLNPFFPPSCPAVEHRPAQSQSGWVAVGGGCAGAA